MMELKIKALSDKVGRGFPRAALRDRRRGGDGSMRVSRRAVTLQPGERRVIPSGIAIALPSKDYVALVFARSGLGIKKGIALSNGVGVIDSDYRGEVGMGLINLSDEPYTIQPGDRVAQMMISPVILPALRFVDELDETARGAGGLGSTGR